MTAHIDQLILMMVQAYRAALEEKEEKVKEVENATKVARLEGQLNKATKTVEVITCHCSS